MNLEFLVRGGGIDKVVLFIYWGANTMGNWPWPESWFSHVCSKDPVSLQLGLYSGTHLKEILTGTGTGVYTASLSSQYYSPHHI